MTRNSSTSRALEDGPEPTDTAFRLAAAVYGGGLLAGVLTTMAAVGGVAAGDLGTTYAVGFAAGLLGGFGLASADRRLPARIGRTTARRLVLVVPAIPFVLLWFVPLETGVGNVALLSVGLVITTGYVLSQLAGNRYVESVTSGGPAETWRWTPPGSPALDLVLAGMWLFLAVGNAATGRWLESLLWLAIGGGWIVSCLAEGRWSFGPGRERCEIRLYDAGLVKRRPYTKTFVAWDDIGHTRLRGEELVLDYGLRDVRFDRDELEDPEAVLEAIDRRLAALERQ